jgi:3-phenylpropionate/trans-cinnamate dioxygenase ferredoxin reductase subunit
MDRMKGVDMPHYKYLIIGGGMTADAALGGIRSVDESGSVGMISAEENPPYDRPPLTKGLWKNTSFEDIWRGTGERDVDLYLGTKVQSVDPEDKRVTDDQGREFTYEKLLLATGGTPRELPFGPGHIIYYRTVEDYKKLRELAQEKRHFAVIGGGFIGSEIAAALAMNDQPVSLIFPEEGIGARHFPDDLSDFLNDYYRQHGVEVITGETVRDMSSGNQGLTLKTESGRQINADVVVAGIGILPNTKLAESAGLQVDDGIIVDEFLRTNDPDIYAAGDVASFYNPALDKRMRVEHEDNANTMGKIAGKNMAGDLTPYHYLPMFYSDLFDLGYEAVGDLNSSLETVSDWQEPFKKGIVYYLKDQRVRGILAWNVWEQVEPARKLIAEPGPFTAETVKKRLPA